MVIKSSYQGALGTEHARVQILNANVSPKYARAIGIKIKGLTIKEAINYLRDVIAQKKSLPLTKVRKVSHKKGAGIASGRYPKKTSETIVKALKQLRTNADAKMLDADALRIIHFASNPGSRTKWQGYFKAQHGRRDGNPKLRTRQQHIEIIAGNVEAEANIKKEKTSNQKQAKQAKNKLTPALQKKTDTKGLSIAKSVDASFSEASAPKVKTNDDNIKQQNSKSTSK